jgi:uncharacterized protein (DUF433 family)
MRKSLGRFVILGSKICHGQPTFRGTRILVNDVLEQVAQGLAWDTIEEQWRGAINQAAISEAVRLTEALLSGRQSKIGRRRLMGGLAHNSRCSRGIAGL